MTHYAPLVIWIGVIAFMSSGQASMEETGSILRPILEYFFPAAAPETITYYHGFIRKFAHFAEYFVLGVLAFRAFQLTRLRRFVLTILFVVAIAALDEFNQRFELTRTSSIWDVAIDASGGLTAAILSLLATKRSKKSAS